ncbi:MAG: DUF1702 family protein [Mastigocoleus sp. MO_167.B18]|uniref:DUF1702 family protein n=1 Tax=Mastigocoleus sp. MO_188.B34 TaxID=3036635 RepID=UPI0026339C06|nr:DUF1702 family protein [Mastigocoleus sp. MO_188.B34]MDJ0697857.1 DUF1702 family protein [Mastigocoleus sp. MO_188.B34]MDJ0772695.1 DUF1702 family protein [Mastigocoleus sp. MO_167.B18]
MILNGGFLRRFLLGISISTDGLETLWTDFAGIETESTKQLRSSSNAFFNGYNTALEVGLSHILISELQAFNDNLRGFAYEGAGMGLAMIDYTSFSKESKLQKFVDENPNYKILAHIGAGLAIAALNRDIEKSLALMNPMQRSWVIDGYGFYNGIFKWKQSVQKQIVPKKVTGYARQAFDRGLGRSLWFYFAGNIDRIVGQLQKFPESRHADMWSGIGLASTYAGIVSKESLRNLKAAAGSYTSDLSLGSIQAANIRYLADNIVDYTNLACSIFCGMSAEDAAKLTFKVMEGLNINEQEALLVDQPIYETYREGIRTQFIRSTVAT